jgi:hypothetical protein
MKRHQKKGADCVRQTFNNKGNSSCRAYRLNYIDNSRVPERSDGERKGTKGPIFLFRDLTGMRKSKTAS